MQENATHYFELFKKATTFILDVDGVLTDGSLLVTNNGDQLRTMNIRDGYALQLAVKKGFTIIVITGGTSEGVVKRLQGLGIQHILSGVENKIEALNKISETLSIELDNAIYMGDDIPDLEVMQLCGIRCCPLNAAPEIINVAEYVSPISGGHGCVRDVIEKVLKLQHKW
ncbi:MAG: HAD-IIIA family hydrolase [Chitinophagales bacterium]|nr:HAD-IIIA family hydrolase [Chitinophagales bacterium]